MKSLAFSTFLILASCGVQNESTIQTISGEAVIYGEDSRTEINDADLHYSLAQATAMIINSQTKYFSTLEEAYPLCKNERFLEQKLMGSCSGVLISANKVLTASHCVDRKDSCANSKFVFGLTSSTNITNIYKCKTITTIDTVMDYAIVEMDRDVTDAKPVTVSTRTALKLNESVISLSYPLGLPLKKDFGKIITLDLMGNTRYFRAEVDTFRGSSGSPLFDSTGELIGILTNGADDILEDEIYRVRMEGGCVNFNHCKDNSCRGEVFLKSILIPQVH
ncbi:MAG: trypsin-like serine peptidase [Bdellovibrio sp.]